MNPYYLMTLLFLALAVLGALDTSLVTLQALPSFPGMRWVLVHTVTLGALVEFIFGLAPELTAALSKAPRPSFRWHIWFLLNSGLIILYAGIPLVNAALIIAGGTLVFAAATLMLVELLGLANEQAPRAAATSRRTRETDAPSYATWFLAGGLLYLLLGITIGTGLWLNWAEALRIFSPKEVHVHSNLWGFAAMVLAGLLLELYPRFTGRPLAHPRLVPPTFWCMEVGTLGMVIGPWINSNASTTAGLILHTVGTLLMIFNMVKPLWGRGRDWIAGIWHLAAAYVWFMMAVVVAPLVVAGGGAGAEVAGSGGPILIFGWILQVGYALIHFIFGRSMLPAQRVKLGGTWFTLATSNGGSLIYWISMFLASGRSPMRGIAYLLWIVSLIPILINLADLVGGRLEQIRKWEGSRRGSTR